MTASGQQRRLVEQVCQIGTGKAGGGFSDGVKVHILFKGLFPGVNLHDGLTAFHIGHTDIHLPVNATLYVRTVDRDLTIKTTGAQQCRIQNIGAIGCGDQDDRLAFLKTVHLDQQLVERLLALVVTAA